MQDRALAAVTDDLAFRVITARTTDTVRENTRAQGVKGEAKRQLAELLTGAVLVRMTMAPQLRVQAILQGDRRSGQLVADSHPEGWARGLVQIREPATELALGGRAVLQVMRSMPNGQLHQGIVEVPPDAGIKAAMMSYLQHSEQVICVAGMACAMEGDEVKAAGGFLVQLLPEAPEASLAIMTERLDHDFADLERFLSAHDGSTERLLEELLYGMPHQIVEETPLRFDCNCSQVRVMTSLATLTREDIEDFVRSGETLELRCDYCDTPYSVAPEQLRGLLESS